MVDTVAAKFVRGALYRTKQTWCPMDHPTTPNLAPNGKRTTSVRLKNLDLLERVVREFGFKDRSHFFQLCTDAMLRAHAQGHRLEWPPSFVVRD